MTRERALEIQSGVYAFMAGFFGIATIALAELPMWPLGVPTIIGLMVAPSVLTTYLTGKPD